MENKPTPEEILEKVTGKKDGYFHESVVQAMQEYAELYHKEKLRGELIAWEDWCDSCIPEMLVTDEERRIMLLNIEKYLKTKE